MKRPGRCVGSRYGFTLIELLVVIAIIVVLLSLLTPALQTTIERGRQVACMSNLRQIAAACIAFCADHDGIVPVGSEHQDTTRQGPQGWQRCWMGREVLRPGDMLSKAWPRDYDGTILPYIGGKETARKMYRCPSLKEGELYSGVGSNGRFDYAMVKVFSGMRLGEIPLQAQVKHGGEQRQAHTPWVVEEDPYVYLNTSHIEPGHGNADRLGNWHLGRGFYTTYDGSVHSFHSGSAMGPQIKDWQARTPSGKYDHLGYDLPYGGWREK